MSYNENPEWTKQITYPSKDVLICPYCKQPLFKSAKAIKEAFSPNEYYEPMNIPPTITFNCANIKCEHCDDEITFTLSVLITATCITKEKNSKEKGNK